MAKLVRYVPQQPRITLRHRVREAARSFWRPAIPLTAFKGELGAEYGYSGDDYAAGIGGGSIDPRMALTFSAVYDAVNQISSDVAKLPLNLRKYRDTGGSDVYDKSDVHWLFKRAANPETKAIDFRRTITAHALTSKGGFAEIQRDGLGRPKALWILTPDRVQPYRDRLPKGGYGPLQYKVDGDKFVEPADMLHIRGLGYDSTAGYEVIELARKAISLALSAENFGSTMFRAGAYGGVLSTEDDLDEDQQKGVRGEIERYKSGFRQFLTLFGRKWTYQRTMASSTDVGLEKTRDQQVEDVARFFNMPLHKLKVAKPGAVSYASVEANSVEYLTGCLMNWLSQWEGELNFKLIPNLEKRQQFFKHNSAAIVRGDIKARYEAYSILVNLGVLSADEVRELEDINPQPGGQGQMYLVQGALVPKNLIEDQVQSQIDKNNQPPPAPAPVAAPASDGDADVSAANERAQKAEQAAQTALDEASAIRAELAKAEGVSGARADEIERLRQSEQHALSLAATLTAQAESLRSDHASLVAARDAEAAALSAEKAALALDRDAALSAAEEARAKMEVASTAEQAALAALEMARSDHAAADARARLGETAVASALELRDAAIRDADAAKAEAAELRTAADRLGSQLSDVDVARAEAERRAAEAERRADAAITDAKAAADLAEEAQRHAAAASEQAIQAAGAKAEIEAEIASLRSVHEQATADAATAQDALKEMQQALRDGAAASISAHREAVVETMRRMVEKEVDRAKTSAGRPDKLQRWLETFYESHEDVMRSNLLPAIKIHLAFIRSDEDPIEMTRRLVAGHVDESRRHILAVLDGDADGLASSVGSLTYRWLSERPSKIADLLMQKELDYVSRL